MVVGKKQDADPFARLRSTFVERRSALGLSVADVADATKIGASKIRKLERDASISPRLVHVARLARFYRLTGDEVFALLDLPEGIPVYQSTADGYDALSDY